MQNDSEWEVVGPEVLKQWAALKRENETIRKEKIILEAEIIRLSKLVSALDYINFK